MSLATNKQDLIGTTKELRGIMLERDEIFREKNTLLVIYIYIYIYTYIYILRGRKPKFSPAEKTVNFLLIRRALELHTRANRIA